MSKEEALEVLKTEEQDNLAAGMREIQEILKKRNIVLQIAPPTIQLLPAR